MAISNGTNNRGKLKSWSDFTPSWIEYCEKVALRIEVFGRKVKGVLAHSFTNAVFLYGVNFE